MYPRGNGRSHSLPPTFNFASAVHHAGIGHGDTIDTRPAAPPDEQTPTPTGGPAPDEEQLIPGGASVWIRIIELETEDRHTAQDHPANAGLGEPRSAYMRHARGSPACTRMTIEAGLMKWA